jgi:putative transcriptional regulator
VAIIRLASSSAFPGSCVAGEFIESEPRRSCAQDDSDALDTCSLGLEAGSLDSGNGAGLENPGVGVSDVLDLRGGVDAAGGAEVPGMKNRLRVLRAERAWSQADLAKALEVSRQSVNAIETGKYDPSLPLAFRLARLFGMRIEEIFLDEG